MSACAPATPAPGRRFYHNAVDILSLAFSYMAFIERTHSEDVQHAEDIVLRSLLKPWRYHRAKPLQKGKDRKLPAELLQDTRSRFFLLKRKETEHAGALRRPQDQELYALITGKITNITQRSKRPLLGIKAKMVLEPAYHAGVIARLIIACNACPKMALS